VTGRADGTYTVEVFRDGTLVSRVVRPVNCDTSPPILADAEIQVVNACRAGLGYLLFQFSNASASPKGYVIDLSPVPDFISPEGIPRRSTSAGAFGQSVRAVTGRPNGLYNFNIIMNGIIQQVPVTVNCS